MSFEESPLRVCYAPATSRGAYDVLIGGRVVGYLRRAQRRWRLECGAREVTLASLPAAVAFVARYADRIADGKAIDEHLPLSRATDGHLRRAVASA
jgi:hypothetical protein